jgi:hypothetical protein
MSPQEIEKHYERCEFDDECDFCETPEGESYVSMSPGCDGVDAEANYYICGKCAPAKIEKDLKDAAAWCDEMDRRMLGAPPPHKGGV